MARSEKPLSSKPQVVVVDSYVEDYDRLVEMAKQKQLRLTITTTGSGALRLASSYPDALWLVSTRLPDMRGLSLLEMLKSLLPKLTAFVVDPSYDQENERQALRLSAAHYLCKPVQAAWVKSWRGPPCSVPASVVESPAMRLPVGRKS